MAALDLGFREARADVIFYDKDGWSVWTNGRMAAHLQYIAGEGAPRTTNTLFGQSNAAATDENNSIRRARIGSGWVGTQLGMGIGNQLTETVKAKAYFAVSLSDITNNKDKTQAKGVDYREAFASFEGGFGSVSFGRSLSIFGSGLASSIYMYSYGNGAGHPCDIDGIAITCGPVGAGGIFPGFNAQVQYSTPNMRGFGMKVSVIDPSLLPGYTLRPLPRVEGEATYDLLMGNAGKLTLIGQGLWQTMGRLTGASTDPAAAPGTGTESTDAFGGIAAARLELGGFRLGGGYWGGKGLGTGVPLQGDQAVDSTGQLRSYTGFMAHALFIFGNTDIGAGVGRSNVEETANDKLNITQSLIASNTAFHAVAYRHIGALVLGAEFMHWISEWHRGEEQAINFMGLSANFLW